MVMSDTRIRELIDSGVLRNALPDNVGPVSYDLVTKTFCTQEGETTRVELAPGDSVFVACRELIELPADMTAEVKLRNSRIRQGLSLEAPLYFPGHHTRVFYRVTNSSADAITLDTSHGIAQLVFSSVEGPVEHPYDGVFSDELDYQGLGRYHDVFANDIKRVEDKVEQVEGIERRMYGNVLALMAIFAAIFTLVNVNIQAVSWELSRVIVMNLATVGSFALLGGLIVTVIHPRAKRTPVLPWVIAVASFVAAVLVAILC